MRMFVSLFVCEEFLVGQMRHVRMDACVHMRVRRRGEQVHADVCTCGVYMFSWPRFQSLERDGGGTLPRGVHMVRAIVD